MTTGDRIIRWAAAIATAVVAAIAAVISYTHAYELTVRYGESGATARALPLTVDGLIVTCSLVLLDAARRGRRAPVLAWLLLAAGISATVGANVAHGLSHGAVGAVIAGWPALVAVGSFEMLARLIRGHRPEPVDVDEDGGDAGLQAGPAPGSVTKAPTPDGHEQDAALAGLVATARDRFAETLAGGAVPSVRALRRELHIGHPRAVRVLDALAGSDHTDSAATAAEPMS